MATREGGGPRINGTVKIVGIVILLMGNAIAMGKLGMSVGEAANEIKVNREYVAELRQELREYNNEIRANREAILRLREDLREYTNDSQEDIKEIRALVIQYLKESG